MMHRMLILSLVLLIVITLFSCGKPGEEAEVEADIAVEEETIEVEEIPLPAEFPVYPGAVYTHYFNMRGFDVFEFVSTDAPQLFAENYMELLVEKGYEVTGESSDKYFDIQVTREGENYAFIEGEMRDAETKIRISFTPEQ